MRSVLRKFRLIGVGVTSLAAVGLIACADEPKVADTNLAAISVKSEADLPVCSGENNLQVVYAVWKNALLYCDGASGKWRETGLAGPGPQGPQGAAGKDGRDGKNGKDGKDGKDGKGGHSSCDDVFISITEEPPGENCENGGVRLEVGT
ncbi:MAG: hypothetical protein KIS78_24840, partial [Labilithrix sp.]|nr:hypothetical protein [Labilithrix sp.]